MNITRGRQTKSYLMALYGLPGVGKTLLATQSEAPIILDLEGGSRTFDCARVEIDNFLAGIHVSEIVELQADELYRRLQSYMAEHGRRVFEELQR